MRPFSTPSKHQGVEEGCIGDKWIKKGKKLQYYSFKKTSKQSNMRHK